MTKKMKIRLLALLAIIAFLQVRCSTRQTTSRDYYITDFGAKGDSITLNTKAIQAAIDHAFQQGGGKVIVNNGIYLTGTLFLRTNVTLEVPAGAVLLGSPRIEDYPTIKWGHNKDRQPYHLIYAQDAHHIEICGGGIIDGNGQAFWKDFHPDSLPKWIMPKEQKISPMLEIENCTDVRIKDVTLKTGGGWTAHLYNSDRIQVQGVKILNNVYAPNGDGIDISGCTDVTISDCIIKTCDDAICLKTAYDTRPCKRVTVTNNIIECLCAAIKIGNESFFDISQVTISNNIIYGSSRAIGIYAESAGTVEDITITNTVCDTKVPLLYNRPIHISLWKNEKPSGANGNAMTATTNELVPDGNRQPALKNVIISNFIAKTDGRILITAENGRMIENLILRDIILDYPLIENPITHVEKIKSGQFSPRNPEAKKATAAVVVENVNNFVLDNLQINWTKADTVPADWKFAKKIANGTLDYFYPDYTTPRPVDMSAIWGRNLQGGYIRAPLARASAPSAKAFYLQNTTINIYTNP